MFDFHLSPIRARAWSAGVSAPAACGLLMALAGCGGSDSGPPAAASAALAPAVTIATAATPAPATIPGWVAADGRAAVLGTDSRIGTPPRGLLGDPAAPSTHWSGLARMSALSVPSPAPEAGLRGVAPTPRCREGFLPPTDLVHRALAALPPTGAALHHAADRAAWRQRLSAGPFRVEGDHRPGSPGDTERLRRHTLTFERQGEPLPALLDDSVRARHGALARDAAFLQMMEPEPARLQAVRRWLLDMASHPANDFAVLLCYSNLQGQSRDGYFAEAPWLLRWLATFDAVRGSLPEVDRLTLENYARRQAWFFATHLDHQLRELFPQRLAGRYDVRGANAADTGDAVWWTRRLDTNGDCHVDDADAPQAFAQHTHVRADGTPGPRVAWLTLWFNNRRAAQAAVAALAGVMLDDPALAERGKRYVMEWLTWSVYPDGSTGETARNGEYCIARQGLVYTAIQVQAALLTAQVLARQGDTSLSAFQTRDGLFGTASASGQPPKSLALTARTLLDASDGRLGWHQHEPWRATQAPRPATALGSARVAYLGGRPVDAFHELGLLALARVVPEVPVAARLLAHPLIERPRDAAVPVDTGLGEWSDPMGLLPAAYLLRPVEASAVLR